MARSEPLPDDGPLARKPTAEFPVSMGEGENMARTSTVVWSVIGAVIAILGTLGMIYGPTLYREGRALVGPIVEIAQSEERLKALNEEIPSAEPAAGTVEPDRFAVFLDIRRDLLPRYLEWQSIERELERNGREDWESAKEVLAAVQGVITMQVEVLRKHQMSPAEFVRIEDLAYRDWADSVADDIENSAVAEKVREITVGDLEALAELEGRYGPSQVTRELAARLNRRLDSLDNPSPPTVEGVSEATSLLFWQHRQELMDLDLGAFSELHEFLRGKDVNINIDNDGE
jgi:hypothetical protein